MTKDSQVQKRKQLFFLAVKVTRYKSLWLFLCLCRKYECFRCIFFLYLSVIWVKPRSENDSKQTFFKFYDQFI